MSTVEEIKTAIETLSSAERAELDYWLQAHRPQLDPEVDSPELEAELLKAVRGPHAPLLESELRNLADQALREHRMQSK